MSMKISAIVGGIFVATIIGHKAWYPKFSVISSERNTPPTKWKNIWIKFTWSKAIKRVKQMKRKILKRHRTLKIRWKTGKFQIVENFFLIAELTREPGNRNLWSYLAVDRWKIDSSSLLNAGTLPPDKRKTFRKFHIKVRLELELGSWWLWRSGLGFVTVLRKKLFSNRDRTWMLVWEASSRVEDIELDHRNSCMRSYQSQSYCLLLG